VYLKKLELLGFKSFADRTVFEFGPGVTAVVGPNGCGKSNVVDAFKWILGSQSAKGLRGSEMRDVIFNGTQGRKPLGLAEVTVVFENEDHFFDIEYGEVSITRRLFRSGESEYLINKQKCRLKDIKNLFMDTGFGTTSYSILEQGKIDVLLQASTLDRRVIFEEAAGISKYRARKAESLRALVRVEDNLSRLQDIIDEVEKRIRRVKAQASKARRYREHSHRLQDLRVRMALEDYGKSVEGRTGLSFRLWWLRQRAERLEKLAARLNAGLDEQLEERRGLSEVLKGQRDQVAAERVARERTEEKIAHATERLEELAAEETRKSAELEQTRASVEKLAASIDAEREQLDGMAGEIDSRREGLDVASGTLRERQEEARRLQADFQVRKESIVALIQERSKVANLVVQVTTELASLQGRKARLERSLEAFRAELDGCGSKEETLRTSLEELTTERTAAEEKRAVIEGELAAFEAEIDTRDAALATQREELHRKSSRLDVLRSFEEQLEGVGSGVAELLRRGEAAPDFIAGWAECHGIVAANLTVDRECARAVEAVIGDRAQALVVETQEGALELLDHARSEELGGVGVISLDRVDEIPREFFPVHGGVLGALRDRVEVVPGLEELADRLLANVVLVEDFATAMALARNGLRPFRLVTLAGEVVEPWGGLSVPGESDAGIISRRSEMSELEGDLVDLEARCQEIESGLGELRASRDEAQQAIAAQGRALEEVGRRILTTESAIEQSRRESDRLRRELEVGASEVAELDTEIARRLDEKSEQVAQIEELDGRREETESGVEELEATIAAAGARVDEANEGVSQARLAVAEAEKEEEGLRELVDRQGINLRERQKHVGDLDTEIRRTRERAAELREQLERDRTSLDDLAGRETELAAELQSQEARDHSLMEVEQGFRQEIERVRTQIGELDREREGLQLRDQEERHRRNTVLERIDDEYGLDLVALLEKAATDGGEDEGPRLPPLRIAIVEQLEPLRQRDIAALVAPPDPEELPPSDTERYLVPLPDWDREVAQREAKELTAKIRKLGNVNLEALDELEELEERYQFQTEQRNDLVESERNLRSIIAEINEKSREMFQATFDAVQEHFKDLFRKCFGGGRAELVLEQGVDILEAGIDIVARPPGKKLTSLSLMSGGERTMTTIALLLAIFRSRPSPFCVLDEVDAPLDEANVRRFVVLVQEFLELSQFIIITHNKTTMSAAGTLYGVTMQERGVSKRVAVELESYDAEAMELAAASPGASAGSPAAP